MTEEELAEEYVNNKADKGNYDLEQFGKAYFSESSMKQAFLAGYNKANEWHFVKDGLPKTDGYYLVFNKGTRSVIIGMFVDGQFESCFPVAWKEIVLPELPKESK